MKYYLVSCALIFLLASCSRHEKPSHLFTSIPSSHSNIYFLNKVTNTEELNIFNYRNFYNGGGVAIGDINNDGLPDIFLTGNTSENQLYLNKGDFKFEDISAKALIRRKAKWSTGVVMVDINHDGWLDIYVCNAGYISGDDQENELYINNQDLTFTERAKEFGLNNDGYTTHAAFFDYDLDGDLDVYILNNSFIPVNTLNLSDRRDLTAEQWPVKDFLKKGGDKLLRNDNGHYTDVTQEAGIYSSLIGFGLGITVGDVNNDGWPDMYISNDFYERDYLYINNADGTFSEDIMNRMDHISLSSMGADMADINNDGNPEIFVTDMLPDDDYRLRTTSSFESYSVYSLKKQRNFHHQYMQNTLQLNNGDGTFSEIAHYAGASASDWSWGALIFDMDLDGLKDIYICNGIQHDVTDQDFIDFFADEIIQKMALTGKKEEIENVLNKMPSVPLLNKIYKNIDGYKFKDVSSEWSPDQPSFSNGAAYGDLDNDGDLDLVVNNVNQEVFLYRNNQSDLTDHHSVSLKLIGSGKNTFAIGSTIRLYKDDKVYTADVMPSRGFQSSVDYTNVIGIGKNTSVDSLEILWPGNRKTLILSPAIDTLIVIDVSSSLFKNSQRKSNTVNPLFTLEQHPFQAHTEDEFIDFYSEGLLMHKLSSEGPAYARGDINGDGQDDFIIGGASGQTTMVYHGTSSGWNAATNAGLENESDFEDTAALLHDLDNDGDLDLVMGSGGNHDFPKSRRMQDRVYINDGKGHFTLSPNALPPNGFNTSSIAADDIDLDGDIDLIIGSRSIPGNYGPPPPSYVYKNNGHAVFEDATDIIAPELKFAGMVTDILITDVTGDRRPEWIILREWNAPLLFSYRENSYKIFNTSLDDLHGWWFTVAAEDLDNDGDIDLVLGNRGENFYFSGMTNDQLKLWVSDFDQNGTVENIVTRSIGGKDIPVALKKELTEQLPLLKKKNLKHADYAHTGIEDLIPTEKLKNAYVLNSNYHSSIIAWNNGNGDFEIHPLPFEAQLSSINAIAYHDLNNDGLPDLLLGGNNYGFLPQFSRLDAGSGLVLINKGNHDWKVLNSVNSGWRIKGEIKAIDIFHSNGSMKIFCVINNEKPLLFSLDQKISF